MQEAQGWRKLYFLKFSFFDNMVLSSWEGGSSVKAEGQLPFFQPLWVGINLGLTATVVYLTLSTVKGNAYTIFTVYMWRIASHFFRVLSTIRCLKAHNLYQVTISEKYRTCWNLGITWSCVYHLSLLWSIEVDVMSCKKRISKSDNLISLQ